MRDRDISLRGLAKRMGLNHSQLSLSFSGDRKLQLHEAVQLSSIFGVPLARIVQAMGVEAAPVGDVRVSVIGAVGGDGVITPSKDPERTAAPAGTPADGFAVQVRSAGTPLEWLDATVMFCAKADDISPAALGRLCVAQIKDGPLVVSAVRRGYVESTFNLFGVFSADSQRLEWASPVLVSRH